jgi:hypothetical protein
MVRTATPARAKAAGNRQASRPKVTAPVVDSTENLTELVRMHKENPDPLKRLD